MNSSPIDKLFDLQLDIIREQISPEIFVETIRNCVDEGLPLNLTIFIKLLDCWRGLEVGHLDNLFSILRGASNEAIVFNPEAALTFFKAALECGERIELYNSCRRAA